jgi:hypothetical protein
MPPEQSSIPSSACLRHHLLPVLRRQQLRRQGIPEAVMPGQAAGPAVGRDRSPTLLPTVVLEATVGRDRFPTVAPTVALWTSVGRRLFPTVRPTVAWRPCLARPSSSFSRSASVFAAAARIPLYTAPVREPVIRGNKRCIKRGEEKRGLAILKRYVSGNNGISLPRGVRATERWTAQSISVTSIATGTLKEG